VPLCLRSPPLRIAIPLDGEYPGSDLLDGGLLDGGVGLGEEVVRGAGLGLLGGLALTAGEAGRREAGTGSQVRRCWCRFGFGFGDLV
jgi:hypothetical protein